MSKSPFIKLSDLKDFNQKMNPLIESMEELFEPEVTEPKVRLESWLKKPQDLDETTVQELSDIQDGNVTGTEPEIGTVETPGPTTVDYIRDSIAVAYVTRDGIPVGFATLVDPTKENWKGIIPLDYYELHTGVNLDGRLMQQYFAVLPEYDGFGISAELRNQLSNVANQIFTVVPSYDERTLAALNKNGYQFAGEFDTAWEPYPVQLWIN